MIGRHRAAARSVILTSFRVLHLAPALTAFRDPHRPRRIRRCAMEQQQARRNCGHYLQVYRLEGTDARKPCLWARCRMCKRRWSFGVDVDAVPFEPREGAPVVAT